MLYVLIFGIDLLERLTGLHSELDISLLLVLYKGMFMSVAGPNIDECGSIIPDFVDKFM